MANTDRPHGFNPFGPLNRLRPYEVDASAGVILVGDWLDAETDGSVATHTEAQIDAIGASLSYSVASTAGTVMVADDPHQLFEAQDDAAATLAASDLFNGCDITAGTGSTVTLISAHEIAADTASTSTEGVILLGLVKRADNAWGVNADIVCQLNVGEGLMTVAAGI